MADIVELAVQAAVGLGAGAIGAFTGGLMTRRHYLQEQAERRRTALWSLERALRFTAQGLTGERFRSAGPTLPEAEREALPYFHTLPRELQKALEDDIDPPYPPEYGNPADESDLYWEAARKLREYLESSG